MRNRQAELAFLESQLHSTVGQLQAISIIPLTAAMESATVRTDIKNLNQRLVSLERTVVGLHDNVLRLRASMDAESRMLSVVYKDLLVRKAREHNTDATAFNAQASRQMILLSLNNPRTNEPIGGFPETLECIDTMGHHQLEHVIRILDPNYYRGSWTLEQERARLIAIIQGIEEVRLAEPLPSRTLEYQSQD